MSVHDVGLVQRAFNCGCLGRCFSPAVAALNLLWSRPQRDEDGAVEPLCMFLLGGRV